MDVMAQARRNLQLDLRSALASNAFEVHYQPLLNLHTKRISTCEALLRWPHPVRGMVSPAEFIPVAEEMGLIVEIGNFVLREACLECISGGRCPRGRQHVADPVPAGRRRHSIRAALSAASCRRGQLEIRLPNPSSSTIPSSHAGSIGTGNGHADLARRFRDRLLGPGYLHNYPLNKVKIDRSFLQGVDTSRRSLNLLRSVARLCADLGMSVAVEGIETEEQFDLVAQEASVEEVQGFLFGAAMPSGDIRTMLFAPPLRISKVA